MAGGVGKERKRPRSEKVGDVTIKGKGTTKATKSTDTKKK